MRLKIGFRIVLSLFFLAFSLNVAADQAVHSGMIGLPEEKSLSNEAEECDKPVFSYGASWHSKFADLGRDALDEGGIFLLEGGVEISGLSIGLGYILSDNEDALGEDMNYRESNTHIQYGFEFWDFDAYLGYNRKEYLESETLEDEIIAGFSYAGLPFITAGVDYIYSYDLEGGYGQLYLEGELGFMEERVVLTPYVLEGFDFGYATKDYNGVNHLQAGLQVSWAICQYFNLSGSVNQIWAHEDIKRQLDDADSSESGDFSWGTLGFSGEF